MRSRACEEVAVQREDFERRAGEFFARAQQAANLSIRAVWLGMAQRWLERADQEQARETPPG